MGLTSAFRCLRLALVDFTVRAVTPLFLPRYKGSAFRGAFGWVLKRLVCAQQGIGLIRQRARPGPEMTSSSLECKVCSLRQRCPYAGVFEPRPGPAAERLRNLSQIPRPFVLEPPLMRATELAEGTVLSFRFVLLGTAIELFPYFVVTIREMGRLGIGSSRGRFEVVGIRDGLSGDALYHSEQRLLCSPTHVTGDQLAVRASELFSGCHGAMVTFVTPTRVKYDRHYREKLEFHYLIRSLLRRASTLAYFYHASKLELDFRGLIEAARRVRLAADYSCWDDWERYSNRQRRAMKLGGVLGKVLYSGIGDGQTPEELVQLLCLGRYLHVGKGATFGLGKYEVAALRGESRRRRAERCLVRALGNRVPVVP